MKIQLNHTIVSCADRDRSSAFVAKLLGRPAPITYGPFKVLELDNGVSLDFYETRRVITPQHYAFLVDDEAFDAVFARIREWGIDYWADPGKTRAGQINHRDGGRGVYFEDLDGHMLEAITRPYGSG